MILDPGLAFGTGTHPTTRLCLDWLAHHDIKDKCVIDYGCGSGILALAAARLGAVKVYAVDIDPQAIRATGENTSLNQLEDRLVIASTDDVELPAADILLANILLNPLIELAPVFDSLVKTGCDIVLSGILSTQSTECLASYSQWFKMSQPEYEEEWARLHGRR